MLLVPAAALALTAGEARAAIVIQPGADSVTTSRLEVDFGDAGGNVERVDAVRWRDSGGMLGASLVANNGPGCLPGDPGNQWGEAASLAGPPQPVGSGSTGTWSPRGGRTVQIDSSRPTTCTGDVVSTPARTRYTFFDQGGAASKLRVERTIDFSNGTPDYASPSMRAYAAHLPLSFGQVVHPNQAGTELVTDAPHDPPEFETNWNGVWLALNNADTNAGVVILRETSREARLALASDGVSNTSSVDLLKPSAGWKSSVTETEWLCFYDAVSWPPAQRSPSNLPSQCGVVPVPISTSLPAIQGDPKVGSELTATAGGWDSAASLAFQWLRCVNDACTPIAGATGTTYTPGDADEGKQLRVDVTATATGGEQDAASSPLSDGVKGGPPQSTAPPAVGGEARVEETLTGTPGSWAGSPTAFHYQWQRCATAAGADCVDVPGATGSSYVPVAADIGSTLRLRVRAENSLGTSLPADSAPTAVVQRLELRARFQVSPNPTCTGVPTDFFSTGSKTPNAPIVRYRYTYKDLPIGLYFIAIFAGSDAIDRYLAQAPVHTLYDGPDPSPRLIFNWNRQIFAAESGGRPGDYVRDPAIMTLTITDQAGASASTGGAVTFGQTYSSASRASCPKTSPFSKFSIGIVTRVLLSRSTMTARVPCRQVFTCAGKYTVVAGLANRRARGARSTVVAKSRFFNVDPGATAAVAAKVTRAGRKLLSRKKRPPLQLRMTSVDPAGRAATRSSTLRLTGRRH